MRHKQRPTKASRHKSVTFIIESQTSFGADQHNPTTTTANHNNTNFNNYTNNSSFATNTSATTGSSNRSIIAAVAPINNTSNTNNNNFIEPSPMRKNFDMHNGGHMSDIMRLAFLENNDITIDDCANVDFNSLSTASILQRNIQQQLQQERRDQLRLQQQQQQQQQQQNHHHNQQRQQQQQQFHHQLLDPHQYQDLAGLDYDNDDGDYELSDSRIFATATPNSFNSIRTTLTSSTPKTVQHQSVSSASRSNNGKKRTTKEPTSHVEFSNQVETIQNYSGEGFFCDEPGCGKSFPSMRKLRHHKVVHSDEFPFVCAFQGCAKKFKRKFGIDLHSTTHFDLDHDMYTKTSNNSSLPFFGRRMQYSMCKPCGQKFKTVHEYQYHMLKHGKEPFKCPVKGCGQTFGIWKSFQKHRASHYFNYYCKMDPGCDHHTSNLQLLKLHIYCCHFRRQLPENATLASKDPAEEDIAPRDDHIDVVDDEKDESVQPMHIKQEEESSPSLTESPQKSSVPSTPRRDSRLRKNPPRSIRATLDSSTPKTVQNQSVNSANRSNNGKKRTTKEPTSHVEFSNQVETIQNYSGEGFFCDEPGCGKSFPSMRKLRHHKVVHSDEFPFVCAFQGCAKKFKRKFGIDLHSTTHFDLDHDMYTKTSNNSSLPFFGRRMQYSMCKPCGQKFKTVHEYQYHMLKHGKEPFKCPVKGCGQTFGIWKSFQKHRASHYFNYYCKMDPVCDHSTSNLQLLKLHIYCCHFRRQLPENATLASKDPVEEDIPRDDHIDVVDDEKDESMQPMHLKQEDESSPSSTESPQKSSVPSTPRRDSRLRKNPPRSTNNNNNNNNTQLL